MRSKYYINTNNNQYTLTSDSFSLYQAGPIPDDFKFSSLNFAAAIHIFYPDLTEEMIKFLGNIPREVKLKVLITTDTKSKKSIIENKMKKHHFDYQIKLFKNIGRDIAPSFIGFKNEILESDYFIHLHTKKSLYNPELNKWREDILNKLLGGNGIAKSNLDLLASSDIGMIAPEPPEFIKPHINWGTESDFIYCQNLLSRSGIGLSKFNPLYFPAGSMFIAKTEVIKPLLNTISIDDFQEEKGQISGTMAHAIERSFLFYCEKAKLKWLVVDINQDGQPEYLLPEFRLIKKRPITYFRLNLKAKVNNG